MRITQYPNFYFMPTPSQKSNVMPTHKRDWLHDGIFELVSLYAHISKRVSIVWEGEFSDPNLG